MKAPSVFTCVRHFLPLAALGLASGAMAAPNCDQMSNDVRKGIASDPAKTLMIVEDALVINEGCACEIVRAAIEASRADEALKQQIVQTALAVAPKMAPVITDCAGIAAAPVANDDPTASGKNLGGKGAKEVLPVAPPVEEEQDFTYLPGDIRGVYLMAPGGVGIIGFDERRFRDSHDNDRDKGDKHKRNPPHRRVTRPISRSVVATR